MNNLYRLVDANFYPVNQDTEPELWLEHRRTGIGGSDAGAIMGLNEYASALTVYMQKKGIDGFSGNNATVWGHILEDPIRQFTAKELDIEIESVPGCFRSKEFEFMNANIDGLILIPENHVLVIDGKEASGLIGHEIKTSARGKGFSDSEIPDSYYCQVQHYMAVTKLDWFVLTVFFLESRSGRHYLIKRDDAFIKKLIEVETDFWENYVCMNKMPEPQGVDSETDYLKKVNLSANIVLDEDAERLITEEKEISGQIKELDTKLSELKNRIICKLIENSTGLEDAEKTTAIAGKYRITYNTQIKKSLDSAALKKAGLYDAYAKETSYKVLRISEAK